MSSLLQPRHILLATVGGLANQRQQQIIEFQNAQVEALLRKLGRKRLLPDDNQRPLLRTYPAPIHNLFELDQIIRRAGNDWWKSLQSESTGRGTQRLGVKRIVACVNSQSAACICTRWR